MRARAFFEKARDAAKLLDDLEETEQRARASAELQAQQYTDTHGGGDDAEPPALKLLELAEETADATEAARLTLDAASAILYGPDGRGGLAAEHGTAYADAVSYTYLLLVDEHDAAEMLGVAPQWVERLCMMAFAKLDRAEIFQNGIS